MDKHEIIRHFRENGIAHVTRILHDTAEANGVELSEIENVEVSLYVKDKSKVKWKEKSHFVKLFTKELERLMKKKMVDIEKIGFLTILTPYLDFQDNSLRNSDGTYLSQEDIMNITGFKRRKVIYILNDLKELGLIFDKPQEDNRRKKKYYLNPNLFYRGKEIDLKVKEYFHNQ